MTTPPITIHPQLNERQAAAVMRAIGWVLRESPEAEADHELLVQSLGSLSTALLDMRERREVGEGPEDLG